MPARVQDLTGLTSFGLGAHGKPMRIAFFYPPVGNVCQPYLSTPSLVAYLKQNGVDDVVQYDLNLEATDELLSSERLMRAYRWCYHYLHKLGQTSSTGELDSMKAPLALAALVSAQSAMRDVDHAKDIFRTNQFHDAGSYLRALDTIRSSYRLLSSRHFPTVINNQSLSMRYRLDSSREILAAVYDETENCFIEILSKKMEDIFDADGVPDIAGVSISYFEQLVPGLTLARLIKERSPRTHVTVGGTMISAHCGKVFPAEFFRVFDSIMFFEGEQPFVKLMHAVKKKKDLSSVPNLCFLRNGKVVSTPLVSSPVPMDSIPTPVFTNLPLSRYLSPEPILPIAGSRGCYWRKCTFCTRQHLLDTFRQRPPARIIQDIKVLHANHGASAFFFVDECVSPAVLDALAEGIVSEKLNIRWSCYVRFEERFADKTFCEKLARSGLRMLYFGLESACERVVGLMRKGTRKDVMAKVLEATASAGIMNMILYFVGFPTETREEALESMEFLLDNREHVTYALAGQFLLEEHSPVFDNPQDFGITQISPLGESADLGILYNYTTESGMSWEEAGQMQEYINGRTQDLHKLEFLNRAHLLLFHANSGENVNQSLSTRWPTQSRSRSFV